MSTKHCLHIVNTKKKIIIIQNNGNRLCLPIAHSTDFKTEHTTSCSQNVF